LSHPADLIVADLPGPEGPEKKPLIVAIGGYDSILEEKYPVIGKAALDRATPCCSTKGPGQGEPLRKYGLKFTPEWERPTAAVLDQFLLSHVKPSKIVLFGMSMGGYLAPRAAAFEERLDGVWHTTCVSTFMRRQPGPLGAVKQNPLALKIQVCPGPTTTRFGPWEQRTPTTPWRLSRITGSLPSPIASGRTF
jgi:pimeloyl-ACP methyl ester carboxylesterase